MIDHSHLCFDSDIGSQKPESIINTSTKCPFCDHNDLEEIIEQRGKMILVKNKYPVLKDAFQTVLIETDECYSELSTYSKKHLYALIRFGVEKWLEMKSSGDYQSAIFYKNHGPLSGGTIRHPHMQIVGLKYIDIQKNLKGDFFEGFTINKMPGIELNISTKPKVGFFEFNVVMDSLAHIDRMADYIQIMAHYALNHFHRRCSSYNLFFYQLENKIITKIMPRFVTSPIFIGYSIPHVSSRTHDVVKEVQSLYF
ncbi:hypothetical protein SDC9_27464 [bioreactor metagenome]|uniref:DUF4931 domain-containing protein n=1 Tax=bioreactor metagenome TaxID=1076179 RepID=A0A644UR57_9ZZZZ|nr:DUF4931 domain-containing protein [Negativicutes bacterium]